MSTFTFPLRYLWLVNERKRRLVFRDWFGVVALAVILAVPFWATAANYFGPDGFLDKFGSFAGVLTGFYVAGLLAVATFAAPRSSLDELIVDGPVIEHTGAGEKRLSRRQYVSVLFGYLAFVSLVISLVAIVFSTASGAVVSWLASWTNGDVVEALGGAVLFMLNLVIANMVATTCHGLYYMIEKLYETKVVTFDRTGKALPDQHDGRD